MTLANGKELQIGFGARVPMRDGHEVVVVYMGREGDEPAIPVALFNRATGQLFRYTPLAATKFFQAPPPGLSGCLGALLTLACFVAPAMAGLAQAGPWIISIAFLIPFSILVLIFWWARIDSRRILRAIEFGIDAEMRIAAGFGSAIPPETAIQYVG